VSFGLFGMCRLVFRVSVWSAALVFRMGAVRWWLNMNS
jgi:hypothetical protein